MPAYCLHVLLCHSWPSLINGSRKWKLPVDTTGLPWMLHAIPKRSALEFFLLKPWSRSVIFALQKASLTAALVLGWAEKYRIDYKGYGHLGSVTPTNSQLCHRPSYIATLNSFACHKPEWVILYRININEVLSFCLWYGQMGCQSCSATLSTQSMGTLVEWSWPWT